MPYHDSNYERSWKMQTKGVTLYPVTLARLYEAAPAMLDALKRMREVFEQLADGDWRRLDATYVDQLIDGDGLLGCDQAIAKAEGRTDED